MGRQMLQERVQKVNQKSIEFCLHLNRGVTPWRIGIVCGLVDTSTLVELQSSRSARLADWPSAT